MNAKNELLTLNLHSDAEDRLLYNNWTKDASGRKRKSVVKSKRGKDERRKNKKEWENKSDEEHEKSSNFKEVSLMAIIPS